MGERRDGAARWLAAGLCMVTLLSGAGAASAIPLVSIDGGSGLPGGTVTAVIALSDDPTNSAASAIVTVGYDDPPLSIDPLDCEIAERLSASHDLTVEQPQPGDVRLTIVPIGTAAPLQDGELATCPIVIALGTPTGTSALALGAMLRDGDGESVPANVAPGFVFIESAEPTPTPTNTHTPTYTPTVTETPIPTATFTVTQTATATRFQPTVNYDREGESCAVVTPRRGSAWPLLGLLALLLLRKRSA